LIPHAEEMNVKGLVITSSPGPKPASMQAMCSGAVPLLTPSAAGVPSGPQ